MNDPEPNYPAGLAEFVDKLHTATVDDAGTDDFGQQWQELLSFHAARLKEDLARAGWPPEKIKTNVVRRWAVLNPSGLRFDYLKRAPDSGDAVETVGETSRGKFAVPGSMRVSLETHPLNRATIPAISAKDEVLRRIAGASLDLSGEVADGEPQDRIAELIAAGFTCYDLSLASSAEALSTLLHKDSFADPAEVGWMTSAKKTARFWSILRAALEFGRRDALRAFAGDSDVESTLTQGRKMLAKGKKPKGLSEYIDQALAALRSKDMEETLPNVRDHLHITVVKGKTVELHSSDQAIENALQTEGITKKPTQLKTRLEQRRRAARKNARGH